MLERAILEKKGIGHIATARGLFGHWIGGGNEASKDLR